MGKSKLSLEFSEYVPMSVSDLDKYTVVISDVNKEGNWGRGSGGRII